MGLFLICPGVAVLTKGTFETTTWALQVQVASIDSSPPGGNKDIGTRESNGKKVSPSLGLNMFI